MTVDIPILVGTLSFVNDGLCVHIIADGKKYTMCKEEFEEFSDKVLFKGE